MKQAAKSITGSPDALRRHLVTRLDGSQQGPRPLVELDLPPAAAAHYGRMYLKPASVLVPLVESHGRIDVLLTQRSESLRMHAGQISFPGGSRDPDDRDAVETALREAKEEIDLDSGLVEVIGLLDDYPTGTGFRVTPVVGLVNSLDGLKPDGNEVTALLHVPLYHLLDPGNYRKGSFVREGIELPFLEIIWQQHRIWGATAGMLHNLCSKLS